MANPTAPLQGSATASRSTDNGSSTPAELQKYDAAQASRSTDNGSFTPAELQKYDAAQAAPAGGVITIPGNVSQQQTNVPDTSGVTTEPQRAPSSFSPEQLQSYDQAQNQTYHVSPTDQSVEPQQDTNNFFDRVGKDLQMGWTDIGVSGVGMNGYIDGLSSEEMQKQADTLTGEVQKSHKTDAQNKILYPILHQSLGDELVQGIPAFATTVGGTLATGVGLAALGASAPFVAGGSLLVGGTIAASLALGQMYKWLKDQGVDTQTAREGALFTAAISGGLGALDLSVAGKLVGSVAKDAINSPGVKSLMVKIGMKYALAAGANVTIGEMNDWVVSSVKWSRTQIGDNTTRYTSQDWMKDAQAHFMPILTQSLVGTALAESAGAALGAAQRQYHEKLRALIARVDEHTKAAEAAAKERAEKPVIKEAEEKKTKYLAGRITKYGEAEYEPKTKLESFTPEEMRKLEEDKRKAVAEELAKHYLDNPVQDIQTAIEDLKPDPLTEQIDLDPLADYLTAGLQEEVQGINPVTDKTATTPKNNPIANAANNFNSTKESVGGLLNHITKDMPPDKRHVANLITIFIHKVVQRKAQVTRENIEKLHAAIRDATGLSQKAVEKMSQKLAATKVSFTHAAHGGGEQEYHSNAGMLLQDYAWAFDRDMRKGLNGRGFTLEPLTPRDVPEAEGPDNWQTKARETLFVIEPRIGSYLRGHVEDFNSASTTEPLVKAFKAANGGKDLKMKGDGDLYYGRGVRDMTYKTDEKPPLNDVDAFAAQYNDKMTGQAPDQETRNPVITIERVKNSLPVVETDMHSNAIANARMRADLTETWAAGYILKKVLGDGKTRRILKNKFGGEDILKQIDMAVQDSLHGSTEYNGWSNHWALRAVTENFVGAKMGLNATRILMHGALWANVSLADDMTPDRLLEGTADFLKNPVKNAKRFAARPFAKDRYDQPIKKFISDVENGRETTLIGKAKEYQLRPIVWGDKLGVVPAWHAVYYVEKNIMGLSDKAAMEKADYAINHTVYSASVDQVSNQGAGRELVNGRVVHSSPMKIFHFAMKVPTKGFELQIQAIRDAMIHPTPDNYAKGLRTVATLHLANAVFEALKQSFTLTVSKDPNKCTRAMLDIVSSLILGPLPPIDGFVLSTAGVTIRDALLHRHDRITDLSTYIEAIANDCKDFAQAFVSASNKSWQDTKANERWQNMLAKCFNELAVGVGEALINGVKTIANPY